MSHGKCDLQKENAKSASGLKDQGTRVAPADLAVPISACGPGS